MSDYILLMRRLDRAIDTMSGFALLFPVAFVALCIFSFAGYRMADEMIAVDLVFRVLPQGFILSCAAALLFKIIQLIKE